MQGQLVEIPGVITAAPSLAEARDALVDALHEYVAPFLEPERGTPGAESVRVDIALSR